MRLGEETYSVDPMHPHFETMCEVCQSMNCGSVEKLSHMPQIQHFHHTELSVDHSLDVFTIYQLKAMT